MSEEEEEEFDDLLKHLFGRLQPEEMYTTCSECGSEKQYPMTTTKKPSHQAEAPVEELTPVESATIQCQNAQEAISATRSTMTRLRRDIEGYRDGLSALDQQWEDTQAAISTAEQRLADHAPILRGARTTASLAKGSGAAAEKAATDQLNRAIVEETSLKQQLDIARADYPQNSQGLAEAKQSLATQLSEDSEELERLTQVLDDLQRAHQVAYAALGEATQEVVASEVLELKSQYEAAKAATDEAQLAYLLAQERIQQRLQDFPELAEATQKQYGPPRQKTITPTMRILKALLNYLSEIEAAPTKIEGTHHEFRAIKEPRMFEMLTMDGYFVRDAFFGPLMSPDRRRVLGAKKSQIEGWLKDHEEEANLNRLNRER